jgi:hypothetical protein
MERAVEGSYSNQFLDIVHTRVKITRNISQNSQSTVGIEPETFQVRFSTTITACSQRGPDGWPTLCTLDTDGVFKNYTGETSRTRGDEFIILVGKVDRKTDQLGDLGVAGRILSKGSL